MPRYCVQRLNAAARRFEWLAKDPAEDALLRGDELDWTADPDAGKDLGAARATHVAPLVSGGSVVRFGDAPPEEARDFAAEAHARAQAERDKRTGALIDAAMKVDDIDRAHDVLALMSDEERARWSAPDPVQDAAAEIEGAGRGAPSWMEMK